MGLPEMLFGSARFADGIAPSEAEECVELNPSNPNSTCSIYGNDTQTLPEDTDLSSRLHFGVQLIQRWQCNKAEVDCIIGGSRRRSRSVDEGGANARSSRLGGGFKLVGSSLSNPRDAAAYSSDNLDVAALFASIVSHEVVHALGVRSGMSTVGSFVGKSVEDSIPDRNGALQNLLEGSVPLGPGNRLSIDPPAVNHLGKDLPKVAIFVERPRFFAR